METTEGFGVKHSPALRPAGDFPPKEKTGRIPLRGVVIAWSRQRIGQINRLAFSNGFVMKEAIYGAAADANKWFKQDQPADRRQDTSRFFEERGRRSKVMENVEQNDVRQAAVLKGQ